MNRYITTTLPYVNAEPHIGFGLEFVQADILARAWRAQGDAVFFSTGTDEHGQKIFEGAEKNGQSVQDYVDHYSQRVESLKAALSLSNDTFIRTTSPRHTAAAQEMWRRCNEAGDIYKKNYTGLYCVGCEAFKTATEISEDGKYCLIHTHLELQEITEENYFFRLSKYQAELEKYLEDSAHGSHIIPEWRRLEALNFVRSGLEDFSISREKARLSWGIPVPDDDTQVMYVWFDALTNYISTLGWPDDAEGNFEKFWQEGSTLQFAGKDQVRFQSVMWQAMLMSAQIKTTDVVFYHGFINSGGQKMSKSLGNVISPYDLVEKYGTDATRYLLLRHVHPVDDSDVTWDKLDEWYTANLVNGLGNLVARIMKLAESNLSGPVDTSGAKIVEAIGEQSKIFTKALESFEFIHALDTVWKKIQEADESITKNEPFKVIKVDAEKGRQMIEKLVEELFVIGTLLESSMPATSAIILQSIKENKKPENVFPRLA
jgi:methionyl-tRNA synthetase